jgi:hypothetical protein
MTTNLKRNRENIHCFVNFNTAQEIAEKIIELTVNHFRRATYDIVPLTFVVSDSLSIDVKKQLIIAGIIFNDGYEDIKFSKAAFDRKPIINRKCLQNGRASESLDSISFDLKIISSSTAIVNNIIVKK